MEGWSGIAAIATAGGTLVLAVATFASVRSANRAARIAERSLAIGLRPVLFPSRETDPPQLIRRGDDHWARLEGGHAVVEQAGNALYLAMSLRNVGSGIAVLHAWGIQARAPLTSPMDRPDTDGLRPQSRDLYVAPGDVSFWQAAIRTDDPFRPAVRSVLDGEGTLLVDVLYGDHEGGQRTISRFVLSRKDGDGGWQCSVVRHWHLDRPDPRG